MASDDETVMTVAFPGRPEIALYRRGPVAPRVLLVSASAYPNSAGMLAALVLPAEGKQHVTLKHQKDQLVVYARKAHLNTKKNRHQHDDVPASSIPGGGPSGTSSPAQLRHRCTCSNFGKHGPLARALGRVSPNSGQSSQQPAETPVAAADAASSQSREIREWILQGGGVMLNCFCHICEGCPDVEQHGRVSDMPGNADAAQGDGSEGHFRSVQSSQKAVQGKREGSQDGQVEKPEPNHIQEATQESPLLRI
uniref:Uncharacterized protein n=1 Tax=Ustilaginoidea virens TaxID=1159556 RepID=A0A1X9WE86_USTVR|nr:hypothetical protein [Ustilaginoidea virens]